MTGLDPIEAKAGKGIGWQYYCLVDLERAFAVAGLESRNVVLFVILFFVFVYRASV